MLDAGGVSCGNERGWKLTGPLGAPAASFFPTPLTCTDGKKNNAETDVDCGGADCSIHANNSDDGVNDDEDNDSDAEQ